MHQTQKDVPAGTLDSTSDPIHVLQIEWTEQKANEGTIAGSPREEAASMRNAWEPRKGSISNVKARWARWKAERNVAPLRVPEPWKQPLAGYITAALLQVSATLATLVVQLLLPTFSFVGLLELLVVAVVAVLWGAGPSIFATLLGAALLEWLVLPLGFGKLFVHPTDLIEVGWFLLVGLAVGAVAGRTEQARRRAVDERAQATAREEALRELKARTDEFVSLASHELRSPLTGIKTALQLSERRLQRLAAQENVSAEQVAAQVGPLVDVLKRAEEQVDRQNRLIGDMLDVSRIRANKLEFRFMPVDLAAVVRGMVEEQRLTWHGRTITLEGTEEPVVVTADADRLAQVVTNFLTNALKYSPSEKPVEVAMERDGEHLRVAVRDRGPGLSAAQQQDLWERFHRVPGVRQQSGSGTGLGLGLYIVRSIVEHHGGTVGVESAPGEGSTFWFTLPRASGSEDQSPVA